MTASARKTRRKPQPDTERAGSAGARLVNTGTSERDVGPVTKTKRHVSTPRYVAHCVNAETGLPPYRLVTWHAGAPQDAVSSPARCGSWRCPSCRPYRASVDFRRMLDALAPFRADTLSFFVLTLDRNGTFGGQAYKTSGEAYSALSRLSRNFLSRMNRMCERLAGDRIGSRWISVIEAHRSGWPHCNLVTVSSTVARIVGQAQRERLAAGCTERESMLVTGEIAAHVIGAGWGPQSTAEPIRSRDAVAGYLVKLAGELDQDGTAESRGQIAGEVVKISQVPLTAPLHFRRLRSGRGFLPPRRKGTKTGCMVSHHGRAFGVGLPEAGDPRFRCKQQRRLEVEAALNATVHLDDEARANECWRMVATDDEHEHEVNSCQESTKQF